MTEKIKEQCARCGSCTVVCPVFRVTGREELAARGKLHLLSTDLLATPSKHFQDLFAQCLLCGACEENCSRQLPILELIVAARSTFSHLYGKHPLQRTFAREALSRPMLLECLVKAGLQLSRLSLLPQDSGLRIKLGLLEKDSGTQAEKEQSERPVKEAGEDSIMYFSGCMARYLQPSIAEATAYIAEAITGLPVHEPDQQFCCGLAAWAAGKLDDAKQLAKKNIEAFAGAGEILTSCASCSAHLQKYPALFEDEPDWHAKAEQFSDRVREFTSFVDVNTPEQKLGGKTLQRVYYHEPCHLRFAKTKNDAARNLLAKTENVSQVNMESGTKCCGQGGLFHLGYPELSEKIFSSVHEQAESSAADVVVTSCSGCLMQWQAGLARNRSEIKALHFAVWLQRQLQINS